MYMYIYKYIYIYMYICCICYIYLYMLHTQSATCCTLMSIILLTASTSSAEPALLYNLDLAHVAVGIAAKQYHAGGLGYMWCCLCCMCNAD